MFSNSFHSKFFIFFNYELFPTLSLAFLTLVISPWLEFFLILFFSLSLKCSWSYIYICEILIILSMVSHHLTPSLYRGNYFCNYFPSSSSFFILFKKCSFTHSFYFILIYFISFISIFSPFFLPSFWRHFSFLHVLFSTSANWCTLWNLYPLSWFVFILWFIFTKFIILIISIVLSTFQ